MKLLWSELDAVAGGGLVADIYDPTAQNLNAERSEIRGAGQKR